MPHYFEPPIETKRLRASVEKHRKPLKKKKLPGDETELASNSHAGSDVEDGSDGGEDAPLDFPHAPYRSPKSEPSTRPRTAQRSVKHQHFNVLNTLLHRCLQEHDYKRACRAFAALLRFDIDGYNVDLRRQGLWGIGAEILLRNSSTDKRLSSDLVGGDGTLNPSHPNAHHATGVMLPSQGFNTTRDYLNRLILQYPYKSHRPEDFGEKDIFPVMISMWIFQIQAEAQRRELPNTSTAPLTVQLSPQEVRESKLQELREAEKVKDALDERILSPPYDKDARLLNLRGHVGMWMHDLSSYGSIAEANTALADVHLSAARLAFRRAQEADRALSSDSTDLPRDNSPNTSPASS